MQTNNPSMRSSYTSQPAIAERASQNTQAARSGENRSAAANAARNIAQSTISDSRDGDRSILDCLSCVTAPAGLGLSFYSLHTDLSPWASLGGMAVAFASIGYCLSRGHCNELPQDQGSRQRQTVDNLDRMEAGHLPRRLARQGQAAENVEIQIQSLRRDLDQQRQVIDQQGQVIDQQGQAIGDLDNRIRSLELRQAARPSSGAPGSDRQPRALSRPVRSARRSAPLSVVSQEPRLPQPARSSQSPRSVQLAQSPQQSPRSQAPQSPPQLSPLTAPVPTE